MPLGEIGLFNPAESTYTRPGAYSEALRANAVKTASYLSAMDSFYEQLDETVREFNATLTFKEAELAQNKALTEEQISVSREQIQLQNEQFKSDLALRQEALKAQTEYQTQDIATRKAEINAKYSGSLSLGGESASDKAFDFLSATQKSNQEATAANQAALMKYLTRGSTSTAPTAPTSGEAKFSTADQTTIDTWDYFNEINSRRATPNRPSSDYEAGLY